MVLLRKKLLLLLLMLFSFGSTLFAKEESVEYYSFGVKPGIPKPLKGIKVSLKVGKEEKDKTFIYEYAVENKDPDKIEVRRFLINLSLRPEDAVLKIIEEPDEACQIWRNKAIRSRISGSPIISAIFYRPLGIHENQYGEKTNNWHCTVDADGRIAWSAAWTEIFPMEDDEKYYVKNFRIKPGYTQVGFKIISPGLPGMRKFAVEQPVDISEDDLPDDLGGLGLYGYLEKVHNEVNFFGYTVGPVAPPADFQFGQFVQYLKKVVSRAIDQHWVKAEDKAVLEFDADLDKAIGYLKNNDKAKGVAQLKTLYDKASKLYCPKSPDCNKILSEREQLFFILTHNIDYLLGRMAQ